MKTCILIAALILGAALDAPCADGYALVPDTLEQIINPNFRIALQNHAPDYDQLGRSDQILAFIRVYKSLNYGEDPRAAVRPSPTYAIPYGAQPLTPSSYRMARSGDIYNYVEGYGYRRIPVPSSLPLPPASVPPWPAASSPVGPPAVEMPLAIPGAGAPPYAPPPVPAPRHAPRAHAGP